jgi:5-methylcytosine-specific restriction endonuclease McrA
MALTPLPKLLEKTQKVVNAYVRKRDEGLPCISCGSPNANQAGHWVSVRQSSALRFNEWNINLQCAGCNLYKHGNQVLYRVGLVQKIGEKAVKELEDIAINNRIKKWQRAELEELIEKYKI